MSGITVWFIRCAMVYFLLAILLGIHMSLAGPQYPYMQIHAHFNLLGWMSMMVYGVGYHILPRFSGRPLWSERLSVWHLWLSNIGLVGMTAGWAVRVPLGTPAVLFASSVVEAVSVAFFVVNMLKTVKAAPAPAKPAPQPR
jgi:cytochrome c oxidase cbb3-type subunit 1